MSCRISNEISSLGNLRHHASHSTMFSHARWAFYVVIRHVFTISISRPIVDDNALPTISPVSLASSFIDNVRNPTKNVTFLSLCLIAYSSIILAPTTIAFIKPIGCEKRVWCQKPNTTTWRWHDPFPPWTVKCWCVRYCRQQSYGKRNFFFPPPPSTDAQLQEEASRETAWVNEERR